MLAFLLGYFLLKTFTLNPPEDAKDYRFGFFVDLALIPLAAVVSNEVIEKMQRMRIHLRLPRAKKPYFSFKLPHFIMPIILILVMVVSIYAGFNFDRIMERPLEAQETGRYVVTDEKLQVMQYIQNLSGVQKYVILSDNHMGKTALGALTPNFEEAQLFNLNSGRELYP